MKKYFITAVAALSFGGLMTSCTHDVDSSSSSGDVAQNAKESYEQAFLNTFGRPVEGLDWGFGPSTNASTRAMTRNIEGFTKPSFSTKANITKPGDIGKPTSSKTFYNTLDEATSAGGSYLTGTSYESNKIYILNQDYYDKGESWYIYGPGFNNYSNVTVCVSGTMTTFGVNGGDGTTICFLDGSDVTLSGVSSNCTYYLAPGATVRFSGDVGMGSGVTFIMSERSNLIAKGLSFSGSANFVNNGGTIQVGSEEDKKGLWTDNFTGVFWNNGSITVTLDMGTSNDGGTFYNGSNGSINARNLALNKDVELWNEGSITLSGDFTTQACDGDGHRIYNSGTITTNKLSLNKNCTLWIENGGSVTATGTFECINDNDNIYIGSGSTLSIKSLDLYNNNQLLVNEGTLSVEGAIQARNTSAQIVNGGTLTAASVDIKAGARMHNNNDGVVTISGLTKVTNTNSTWMNDGKYTSGDFEASDYAYDVWNNCKLTVTSTNTRGNGIFHLNRATFFVDGGGSLITDYFYWEDTSNFYMGGKSLVDVKTELNTRNYDSDYGFRGMGDASNYAVLRAKKITKHADVQFSLSCFGYIYVDCDDMFKQGYIDTSHVQAYYYFADTVKYGKEEDCPVSIEGSEDGCNPGYNVTPPTPPVTPVTDKVRVIAEDLTTLDGKADFDFNDVVFDVDLLSSGKVRVTLLAAGGTLPLTVGDQGQQESGDYEPTMEMQKDSQGQDMESVMKYEVHRLFKVATTTMVNTNAAGGANRDAVEVIIDNPSTSSDIHEIANAIPIRVYKKNTWIELEKAVPVGTRSDKLTASKVAVDGTFQWCAERVSINKDSRYQYSDYKGTQKSRFELYLDGKLGAKWWDQSTIASE